MATLNISPASTKRWVMDDEVTQCPLCKINFEGRLLDIVVWSRTHCRFCGGVFCTTCCNKELYMPEHEVVRPPPSERIKNLGFDPTQKQKTCRACFEILKPHQELIKASRGQSRKVVETGEDGMWVPIANKRWTGTGEVLVSSTFKAAQATCPVASVSGGTPAAAVGLNAHSNYEAESDDGTERPIPFMHWLQEKTWLVYAGLLLISVFYRFAQSIGFSGDPIALKLGTPNGNDVTKRSDTHYIRMTNGNLVLREGKPGDPVQRPPLWESGRPYAKMDCKKCVFMLDETGQHLMVKDGRKVLVSFNLQEDDVLRRAIKAR